MAIKETKILDFMLDLETFGVDANPMILQVAAVAFDYNTGETGEEFNQFIKPQSSAKAGLKCTGSTVDWWLTQDPEVFEKVVLKAIKEGSDITSVLSDLKNYFETTKTKYKAYQYRVWCLGMDCSWLFENYAQCKLDLPFPFWYINDLRSIFDTSKRIFGYDAKKEIPFVGKKHEAIDDCKHQIKMLMAVNSEFIKGKKL